MRAMKKILLVPLAFLVAFLSVVACGKGERSRQRCKVEGVGQKAKQVADSTVLNSDKAMEEADVNVEQAVE